MQQAIKDEREDTLAIACEIADVTLFLLQVATTERIEVQSLFSDDKLERLQDNIHALSALINVPFDFCHWLKTAISTIQLNHEAQQGIESSLVEAILICFTMADQYGIEDFGDILARKVQRNEDKYLVDAIRAGLKKGIEIMQIMKDLAIAWDRNLDPGYFQGISLRALTLNFFVL